MTGFEGFEDAGCIVRPEAFFHEEDLLYEEACEERECVYGDHRRRHVFIDQIYGVPGGKAYLEGIIF